MINTTIAAISTPSGRGGIGIIRISGKEAVSITAQNFFPASKPQEIKSHRVYFGYIKDNNNNIVDEVIYIYMKAPKSYTAEDVVEIQSHSNPVVLRKILELLIDNGAVPAEPGEFTKRAFLNGRIDLSQAEAVIDIINAKSKTSLDMALSLVRGKLTTEINKMISVLESIQIKIEAIVDFPDDVDDVLENKSLDKILKTEITRTIARLEANFQNMNIFREGVRVVIAGPPNAGKSSLINKLLNKEKAIVTSVPGTTRDIIEDFINIGGIPVIVSDTAGLQKTDDYVEAIGIERTISEITKSDIVLLMFDGVTSFSDSAKEMLYSINREINESKKIVVQNKTDLSSEIKNGITIVPDIKISIKKEDGLTDLKRIISDLIIKESPVDKNAIIPNNRHHALLKKVKENCESVINGLKTGISYDLIAIDINEAVGLLYEITGKNKKTDVLEGIFNNFCIGK